MAMNGKPILPNNPKAPTQTIGINNAADKKLKAAMRRIQNQVLALMNRTPKERVSADQAGIIFNAEATYKYLVSPALLGQMPSEIGRIIEEQLLENGNYDWYMYEAVQASSDTGAAAEIVNLQAQTSTVEYPVTVPSAIIAPAHQARVELARSRVFEEMQSLSSEMKTNLSRVLADGMTNGDSPRVIARKIYNTIGLPEWNDKSDKASYARALRIARTEINESHRRAKKGERQEARQKYDLQLGVMHLSALKSNTRRWHAQRHGWTGTEQEEERWFSRDGNTVNCQCSTVAVVLDSNGNVRSENFLKQVDMQKTKYFSLQ
ncbi:MAG: phage head morphogenesis protein [Acidiferrobacterales bacterium]|nr:phage head morphogenesis protein [Acidiferrobacterales bacterium]